MPPWPAPVANIPALVEGAGLDLGPMGVAEHYHPTLRILIDGEQIPVPPNIGVDPSTGAMSAVHTHEGDGTIHVEADTVGEVFTVGQLFMQWHVALGTDRMGGVEADNPITVTVNGRQSTGNPYELRLCPDQKILVEVNRRRGRLRSNWQLVWAKGHEPAGYAWSSRALLRLAAPAGRGDDSRSDR